MKQVILGLAATLAIGSAAAQQPSSLVRAKGEVTVEVTGSAKVGNHAVPSGSSFGAKAGDAVNVDSGTAKVTYDNGCTVVVEAGSPYTIADKAPACRKPAALVGSSSTKYYLMAGGDVFSLQKILGHTTLDVTRIYVNMVSSQVKEKHRLYSPMDNLPLKSERGGKKAVREGARLWRVR